VNRRSFIQSIAALSFLPVNIVRNMLKVPAIIDSPIERELVPVSEAQYVNMTATDYIGQSDTRTLHPRCRCSWEPYLKGIHHKRRKLKLK